MSRKKMNLCLTVLLIALYLACLLVSYGSAANYVESDFRHSVKSVKDYFEKNIHRNPMKENIYHWNPSHMIFIHRQNISIHGRRLSWIQNIR